MSYSVSKTAAEKFMERFYEILLEYKSLSEAVAAGRLKLFADSDRESLVGVLELKDWMVPTLYQQEYAYVPIGEKKVTESPENLVYQKAEEACPEGQFGIIGRDYDILRFERTLRDPEKPWVVLTGLGGSGKTALAYGFARWYAETGGCPGGVFVTSFKEKADFGQVVGSIAGFGTDFSILPEEKQWECLVQYLREHPSLLIWDNFEPVAGYPEGAVPLATDEEREKLSQFLKALRGGKSRVIITTRKPDENWLKIGYTLLELSGLTKKDAGQLAQSILTIVGRRSEDFKDDPDYARLLELLRGHPRSMEVVLPHLRGKSPAEIIEALQHRIDVFENVLDASLEYVFTQLSERARKHLPFLGLFTSYVHDGMVSLMSSGEYPGYREVIGEPLDSAGWKAILEEATSVGLIRPVYGVYELHPTFPSFLRQRLTTAVGEDGLIRLDSTFMQFYSELAYLFHDKLVRGDSDSLAAVFFEEANLLRALRLAEMSNQWTIAQYIVQTISEFYKIRGRLNEWGVLRTRLLGWIGEEIFSSTQPDQAALWMFLLGDEADDAIRRNELEIAEVGHKHILAYLISLNDKTAEPNIAVAYHQLGIIAEERQQLNQAEQWYKKALEIRERLGLQRDAATDYHNLGIIAEERQQLNQAEQWYRKALEINKEIKVIYSPISNSEKLGKLILNGIKRF